VELKAAQEALGQLQVTNAAMSAQHEALSDRVTALDEEAGNARPLVVQLKAELEAMTSDKLALEAQVVANVDSVREQLARFAEDLRAKEESEAATQHTLEEYVQQLGATQTELRVVREQHQRDLANLADAKEAWSTRMHEEASEAVRVAVLASDTEHQVALEQKNDEISELTSALEISERAREASESQNASSIERLEAEKEGGVHALQTIAMQLESVKQMSESGEARQGEIEAMYAESESSRAALHSANATLTRELKTLDSQCAALTTANDVMTVKLEAQSASETESRERMELLSGQVHALQAQAQAANASEADMKRQLQEAQADQAAKTAAHHLKLKHDSEMELQRVSLYSEQLEARLGDMERTRIRVAQSHAEYKESVIRDAETSEADFATLRAEYREARAAMEQDVQEWREKYTTVLEASAEREDADKNARKDRVREIRAQLDAVKGQWADDVARLTAEQQRCADLQSECDAAVLQKEKGESEMKAHLAEMESAVRDANEAYQEAMAEQTAMLGHFETINVLLASVADEKEAPQESPRDSGAVPFQRTVSTIQGLVKRCMRLEWDHTQTQQQQQQQQEHAMPVQMPSDTGVKAIQFAQALDSQRTSQQESLELVRANAELSARVAHLTESRQDMVDKARETRGLLQAFLEQIRELQLANVEWHGKFEAQQSSIQDLQVQNTELMAQKQKAEETLGSESFRAEALAMELSQAAKGGQAQAYEYKQLGHAHARVERELEVAKSQVTQYKSMVDTLQAALHPPTPKPAPAPSQTNALADELNQSKHHIRQMSSENEQLKADITQREMHVSRLMNELERYQARVEQKTFDLTDFAQVRVCESLKCVCMDV
jgi:chromosome segregation ATPase